MNLDDIRLKEPDELTDEEKGFLRENQDDLTDSDREAFASALEESEPEDDDGKGFAFESEEDFENRVSRVFERVLERQKKPESEPKSEPKDDDEPIFPKDYKPADWNEAGQKMLEAWEKKQQAKQAEQMKRMEEINKQWDQQLDDIRYKNSDIPKANTKEGKKFDKDLAGILAKYKGVTDMNEAYEIYEATHQADKKEPASDKQKDLAKKVSQGSGGDTNEPERKYEEVAKRSIDQARDAAIRRWEELG